jgi:hypothetical protein
MIALGKLAMVICVNKVVVWDIFFRPLPFVKITRCYHHLHANELRDVRELWKYRGTIKQVLQSELAVGICRLYLITLSLVTTAQPVKKGTRTLPQFLQYPSRTIC